MVSHSSFFRYLHVFSAWNGRQGHDGLVAGCFFTKVGFKRMGNGSVILCRILCFATALAETGTLKFFSTLVTPVSPLVLRCSRCTCSTDCKNSHCTKNVHCDVPAQGVLKFVMTVWCLSFTDFGTSISCSVPTWNGC